MDDIFDIHHRFIIRAGCRDIGIDYGIQLGRVRSNQFRGLDLLESGSVSNGGADIVACLQEED